MNKPKQLGTAFETWIVNQLNHAGIKAKRLAEGGRNDLGDIETWTEEAPFAYGIIEAKARANLNAHQTLEDAQRKAKGAPTFLIWKKLARKSGNERRSQVGVGVMVAMDFDTWVRLIGGRPPNPHTNTSHHLESVEPYPAPPTDEQPPTSTD